MIKAFLVDVANVYKTGAATEHSYRPALQTLLQNLDKTITVINEPKRVACGAPDFILQRGELPVGHVEAKDLHVNLRTLQGANRDQQDRYRRALPNLIYTNCLDWDFYRDGAMVASVTIADVLDGVVKPRKDQFERLESLLVDAVNSRALDITSPEMLARIMAGKAQLMKEVLRSTLQADVDGDLHDQYQAFKEHLIHDITPEDFADLYAETITYGMFAARLHDDTPEDFSRQEAMDLLPKSNPFLRSLFGFIAGVDLDDRLAWVIDDLATVFRSVNISELVEGFGKVAGREDPFVHFYETFLSVYNPEKRKARGVWYTPEAVVGFIVRSVDEILQESWGMLDGLASTEKVTVDGKEVHRVQILDPATGTGTFLAEVIRTIAPRIQKVAPTMWTSYVEEELIPRLHGFELLMAPYSMCHMKLSMLLSEMGYKPSANPPRLGVYLTNSLEEGEEEIKGFPMARWLTQEAREANKVKKSTPIMCIVGNPPYSSTSSNDGEWITGLMDAYRVEPGGEQRLQERTYNLTDDYMKFIRFSEYLINQNGEGVLGFITNHGFLDAVSLRGMRWHLMETFDEIYIVDLHGNARKKEVSPDGSVDENVFDIMTGVAIIFGVKWSGEEGKKKTPARVSHADLWGTRESKYAKLENFTWSQVPWGDITPQLPFLQFVPRSHSEETEIEYLEGFGVREIFTVGGVGTQTGRDAFITDTNPTALWDRVQDFVALEPETARQKYELGRDSRDWRVASAQADVRANFGSNHVIPYDYRPFDTRWVYYTGNSRGVHRYPVDAVMRHMLAGKNVAMIVNRTNQRADTRVDVFISKNVIDVNYIISAGGSTILPLYTYNDDGVPTPNLDPTIYARLQEIGHIPSSPDQAECTVSPLNVFDYIYGVLHDPNYREKYKEFLKYDYPRIPWPKTPQEFWRYARAGAYLRLLHLRGTEDPKVNIPFCGEGDNVITKPELKGNRIYINKTQYFDDVPEAAWTFYIGGYQPAQKWLKDRKGVDLTFGQIKHYMGILHVLQRTHEVMEGLNDPESLWGMK